MSEQSVWDAGYRAGVKKRPISACPFLPYGTKHRDWIAGYKCATEPMICRGEAK